MQHVRVYVQNEGAGEEEAVQSVQHNQQSPSPASSHVLGSTAIITFNLTDCYQQYQLLTCRYTSEDLAYSVRIHGCFIRHEVQISERKRI